MPVIGHAFVGIVTAHEFEPGGLRNPQPLGPLARALWMPSIVGLSYLPDLLTLLGLSIGYGSAKVAGHSVFVALLAGFIVGIAWARLSGGSARMLSVLGIGSILVHDLLDLLQATDRAPFWPISDRVIVFDLLALPDRLSSEFLMCGLPWAVYEGWRFCRRRHSPAVSGRRLASSLIWTGRGLVVILLLSAVAVQLVRREARRQISLADRLLRSGRFADAVKAADVADRWPLAANPGRTDIIRGEAYEGLGDNARAEMFYLRAHRSDPENFWAVADLAEYYASHGTAADRRQRSAPYMEELRRRFPGHRSLRAVTDRVERTASNVN